MTPRVLAICDAVGDFIEAWGFRSIHGRVWSYLAIRNAPVPQSEVADALGVSRSLVHLAVSELVEHGLVHAVGPHRNAPYEARLDVWPTITNVLREREWLLMERTRLALDAALGEAEWAEDDRYDLERLKLLLHMTEFAQTVLRLVLGVRMPRGLDDFGRWLSKAGRQLKRLQQRLPTLFH